ATSRLTRPKICVRVDCGKRCHSRRNGWRRGGLRPASPRSGAAGTAPTRAEWGNGCKGACIADPYGEQGEITANCSDVVLTKW
ncbi:MAG: hypothetical protein WAL39_08620, partial [Xanthobacteraceae bacterium]